jgi:copper chaperone CopZ
MKHLLRIFIVAVIAIFAINTEVSAQKKKEAEVTFSVNVDCPACVKKLESNLPFEKGVKDLKVSLENQTVWFKYRPDQTTKEALAKAVEKFGYKVAEIETAQVKEEKKK